jgi:hypothetical protein
MGAIAAARSRLAKQLTPEQMATVGELRTELLRRKVLRRRYRWHTAWGYFSALVGMAAGAVAVLAPHWAVQSAFTASALAQFCEAASEFRKRGQLERATLPEARTL